MVQRSSDHRCLTRAGCARIGRALVAGAIVTAGTFGARPAAAQSIFHRLNFDKLQISSLGAFIGKIDASQLEPANVYALSADYGEVAPNWRVVFGVSYWESRFREGVIQAFVDSLQKSVSDPTAHVVPSPVTLYDATIGLETRYTPAYSGELKPFVGLGFAAHVINAEGPLIKGTFVERSLDDIAAGFFLSGGVSARLVTHIGLEASARADLLSGFRSVQGRVGGLYYFGKLRGAPAPKSP